MAHEKPEHDYHLVEPSFWPFLSAVGALVMALGSVMYLEGGSSFLFFIGLLIILYVMYGWFSDIVRESRAGYHTTIVKLGLRYGVFMFIASEVMFFVAWFWAFFDASLFYNSAEMPLRAEAVGGVWPPANIETFDPWHLPLLNTLLLLLSGTTVTWAHHALIHNDRKGLKHGLWLTVVIGFVFSCLQALEYSQAAFPFGGEGGIYSSTFYMATGFHGAHVIIGTICLAVCLIRTYKGDFTRKAHFGFESSAWYWHFVDVVWLFLFVAIYIWGS
jgi:cytochrome c oxidase subunit 3